MMSKDKDDGGRAFPNDGIYLRNNGMSLRDWFAGQALAGISVNSTARYEVDARIAYEMADAMLKERAK